MIQSLDALIVQRNHIVRYGIVRPDTVVRALRKLPSLVDCWVRYRDVRDETVCRVSGVGFLALYAAGAIPVPRSMQDRSRSGV
jgi:hypothetical protein